MKRRAFLGTLAATAFAGCTGYVGAGGTANRAFQVVAAHESETCHEPGQYRFEDVNYLGEEWGFNVEITEVALTNE